MSVKLLRQPNQYLAGGQMKYFPAFLEKILPATLAAAVLAGCENAPVSAHASLQRDPVVAPAGSVLRVRLDQALDSERSRPGDRFSGVLESPLTLHGDQVLPKGTIVEGHVLNARAAGSLQEPALLSLTLDSCQLDGRILSLSTETIARVGARHHKRHWSLVAETPLAGPDSYANGAAAGTVGAVDSGEQRISIPAESIVGFTLRSALVV
jgi:hypothetical protein